MTALDTSSSILAVKMLAKFGKAITFQSVAEGIYDPATGDMTANTITSSSQKALLKDFNGSELMSGVVQHGDRKVVMAALGVSLPQPSDKVVIDSETYNIIAVKVVWSGELAALYELQVRK